MYTSSLLKKICISLAALQTASAFSVPKAVEDNLPDLTRRDVKANPNVSKVNCSDVATGRSNDCIAVLNITGYVRDWINTHSCYKYEGFSNCYLRQNGFPALDCGSITSNGCTEPSVPVDAEPRNYYTAYNIHALNAFFKTWYDAIFAASETAEDGIAPIINLVSSALGPANPAANTALATDLATTLSNVTQQVRSNINQTAISVLSNYTEFLAFVEQGKFSETPVPLPEATQYLTYALHTYIASLALVKSDVYATVGKGTDVVELATNGSALAYPIDCKNGLDTQGVCDAWWVSSNYNSSFGLVSRTLPQQNLGKLATNLFGQYTSGELLFEGSYICGDGGANFRGPVNITFTTSGVNTACISALDVYTWDPTCHAAGGVGGANEQCEFLEAGAQKGFWEEVKGGARRVPAAYLGPAIAQTEVKLTRE